MATDSSSVSSSVPSSSVSLPSGATVVPVSTFISCFTANITTVSTFTSTTTFTMTRTTTFITVSEPETSYVSAVPIGTSPTATFQSASGSQGTTVQSFVRNTVLGTSTVTEVVTQTSVCSVTNVVIPSVGEKTIIVYSTIMPTEPAPVVERPKTVTVMGVQTIDGATLAVVHTQDPVVLAVPTQEVKTQVVNQVVTGVTRVGGSVVTDIVVITPSAESLRKWLPTLAGRR
ncbi:hypothetical protein VTK56DRAFT_6984 [Thermocarpiscus australiensis]